jgi:hypothetical protein
VRWETILKQRLRFVSNVVRTFQDLLSSRIPRISSRGRIFIVVAQYRSLQYSFSLLLPSTVLYTIPFHCCCPVPFFTLFLFIVAQYRSLHYSFSLLLPSTVLYTIPFHCCCPVPLFTLFLFIGNHVHVFLQVSYTHINSYLN